MGAGQVPPPVEVRDALKRLTSDACRDAVELAIAEATDGSDARRILEERLGTAPLIEARSE